MEREIQVIIRKGLHVEYELKQPRPDRTLVKDNVVYIGPLKCIVEYINQDTIGLQVVNIQ